MQNRIEEGDSRCQKIKYFSRKEAKKELRIEQRFNCAVTRVYFCKKCKGFHLTSSERFEEWD